METPICKILLIEPSAEKNVSLTNLLIKQNYIVDSEKDVEVGIQKAISGNFNLIICQYEMPVLNGFKVYKKLENHIIANGIPFFLCFNSFVEEDILISLEIGIDNFIIYPYDETIIKHKIENHFKKTSGQRAFETDKFKVFLETSPIAMFSTIDSQVDMVNDAFCKLFNVTEESLQDVLINEMFNLLEDKKNVLILRKFINGLFQQCCLKAVNVLSNSNLLYDIYLSHLSNVESGKMVAIVVASDVYKEKDYFMVDYPIRNFRLPERDFDENGNKHTVKFTAREKQILELSAQGISIKQLAPILNLSERTVAKHRANIMEKVNATNMIEAIAIAQRNHLLVCCPSLDC